LLKLLKRKYKNFDFTFSPLKIRPWIRIRIQIRIRTRFQNPGSGSARNGCGSETLLLRNKLRTFIFLMKNRDSSFHEMGSNVDTMERGALNEKSKNF